MRQNDSMQKKGNNYAFIDSQNVNLAIRAQGWKLDWERFRIYLREKYGVTKAFLFIGYVEGNNELYIALQSAGFICIFKPTLEYKDGTTKGNCDAELVLHAMIEYPNYEKAIIVTGDGDFYCLVQHLLEKAKLLAVLIPNRLTFSALLKFKEFRPYLRHMNDLENLLAYKKRRPYEDRTS
ncbi:MAG: NYN domain-containing protein [Candidatus Pacebacteria bacterium]|nr:NYN domain-containing protein [Candidatus Paceibacterota bacterium]